VAQLTPPPVRVLEPLAEASIPSVADRGAPEAPDRRDSDQLAIAEAARADDRAARPPAARAPTPRTSGAKAPRARSMGMVSARPSRIAGSTAAPSGLTNVPVGAPQPPPFVPAPVDDDAILPLDENFDRK
jgi:hypothetical protein